MGLVKIKTTYGISGGVFLYFFGNISEAMILLASLMFLDMITGTLKGAYQKKLNSTLSRNGIIKKIAMIIGIAVVFMLDKYMESGTLFRDLIVNMFIVTELISNLENLAQMNVIMPSFIKGMLEKYRIIKM